MSRLILINDELKCERIDHELAAGESLAVCLMRLWPSGIEGRWRIYREMVSEGSELAALDLPHILVRPFETYVLVRSMGTVIQAAQIFWNIFLAVAFTVIGNLLAPRRRRQTASEDAESGTSQLAAQTNLLRPGARVPEILGRLRVFPDLLVNPAESWVERDQTIDEWFALGIGAYDYTDEKLGETPTRQMANAGVTKYEPGVSVPIRAVKDSPEVRSISLMTEDTGQIEAQGVSFNAAAKTMSTQLSIGAVVGDIVRVSAAAIGNLGFHKVTSAPAGSQTVPPFVYGLDGTLVDETNIDPLLDIYKLQFDWNATKGLGSSGYSSFNGTFVTLTATDGSATAANLQADKVQNGWLCDIAPGPASANVRGYVRNYMLIGYVPTYGMWQWQVEDYFGNTLDFGAENNLTCTCAFYLRAGSSSGGATPAGPIFGAPTSWYRVPYDNPDQVWVDISFPQGLVVYQSGTRTPTNVDVQIEFRRPGVTNAQVTKVESFPGSTTGPLRWTKKYRVVEDLIPSGLPAGTGIEVRVTRLTEITPDTSTTQHVDETRFERLAGVKRIEVQYPNVTILWLSLTNSRNAQSSGELAFNCVATRRLPTWNGSTWSAPGPTSKWADNFVARCKASDGANKSDDALLDLAGIYALQAQLDALDSGDQGRIAMVLDQIQDIDAELAAIADVVRALVYRVGQKIYVSRDQANATAIALFNGRTKSPDAETVSVRMSAEGENDCVIVSWLDEGNGWKQREYTYPETAAAVNPVRIATLEANWAQGYRRAVFEWNRLKYRREAFTCAVTEEGRICRPGDVVNITDDVANIAISAGEVIYISGNVLTLDHDVSFAGGGTFSILLRDIAGVNYDQVPCTAVAGSPNRVQLSRAVIGTVTLKPRDTSRGSLYAFFEDSAPVVRKWLVTGVKPDQPYVQLTCVNYNTKVFAGDSGALPAKPVLSSAPALELLEAPA